VGFGDEPMTGAQASYLKTLSEECDEPEAFAPGLTKGPSINNSVNPFFGESFFAAVKPCSSSRRGKYGGSG
jgi:hypothetical protein